MQIQIIEWACFCTIVFVQEQDLLQDIHLEVVFLDRNHMHVFNIAKLYQISLQSDINDFLEWY